MKELYLCNHEFNTARTLERLREMVLADGGHIVSSYKSTDNEFLLSNRQSDDGLTVTTHHVSWIRFIYGNFEYYYEVDENPFFPVLYTKKELRGNEELLTYSSYLTEIEINWRTDEFFKGSIPDEEIEVAAEMLFKQLIEAEETGIACEKKRITVPNTYNNGTHRETVVEPPREEKLCVVA